MTSSSQSATLFSAASEQRATAAELPALTLLWHPDVGRVGERAVLPRLGAGTPVELSRSQPRFAPPGGGERRGLELSYVSRKPLRLSTVRGELAIERCGSSTPVAIDGVPLDDRRLLSAAALRRGVVLELGKRVVLLLHVHPSVSERHPSHGLVGESAPLQRLRREISLAAVSDAPLLLRGASGTGKELVARAVHEAGERRDEPYVTVNMAAIPGALAAAELFGARRGAFTGAERRRDGYFAAAHRGSLFLDEIGETTDEVQPLLLRALESGEIQPVGEAASRRVDVRVIAATDADLDAQVASGSFRSTLLYRLAGIDIRLPTLAARRDDIGRLLVHFLERELGGREALLEATGVAGQRPWPPSALVAQLAAHEWPGNVRQLLQVARRLALCRRAGEETPDADTLLGAYPRPATGPVEQPAHETPETPADLTPVDRIPTDHPPAYRDASEVGEDELLEVLRAARFRLRPAAEALRISRTELYRLIEASPRVRKASDLPRDEVERVLAACDDEEAAAAALEVSLHGLRLRLRALGLR